MRYLFGDTTLAAQRLRLLSDTFSKSSKAFLQWAHIEALDLAVDLGCGPGHCTHLLAACLPARRVIGLDNSERFIALGRQTGGGRVSFVLHDVTEIPFPCGTCDLLYCRFLLPHMPDPQAVLAKWATQLRPQGLLLVEDAEAIDTDNPVFERYMAIVEAMLASRSQILYMGKELNNIEVNSLRRARSRATEVHIDAANAASLFHMNLQQWRHDPFVARTCTTSSIDRLDSELKALTEPRSDRDVVHWTLRQIIFEKFNRDPTGSASRSNVLAAEARTVQRTNRIGATQ